MHRHLKFSWTKKVRRIGRILNWNYVCRFVNRQKCGADIRLVMAALPGTALISSSRSKQGTISELMRKGGTYDRRNWRRFSVFERYEETVSLVSRCPRNSSSGRRCRVQVSLCIVRL